MRYLFIFLLSCSLHAIELSPSNDNASVYFISPNDGESISGKVTVRFGLENFGVAPAGAQVMHTGHHHLIIDAPLPDLTLPIPANANYVHFGLGQTEAVLSLAPGKHTLRLLLGNYVHIPHSEPLYSEEITIIVK